MYLAVPAIFCHLFSCVVRRRWQGLNCSQRWTYCLWVSEEHKKMFVEIWTKTILSYAVSCLAISRWRRKALFRNFTAVKTRHAVEVVCRSVVTRAFPCKSYKGDFGLRISVDANRPSYHSERAFSILADTEAVVTRSSITLTKDYLKQVWSCLILFWQNNFYNNCSFIKICAN